jgi:Cu/Ag efflux pump CusA
VAAEEVLVNTRVNGYAIESIKVEIGDSVEAGSELATLDDSAPTAQLAQAEAELVRATAAIGQARSQIDAATANMRETDATLKRNERLRQSGNISESTLDQAKSAASSARANVASARDGLNVANAQRTSAESQRDLARLTLARTRITAPVAGIISARNAQLGEIASGWIITDKPVAVTVPSSAMLTHLRVTNINLGGAVANSLDRNTQKNAIMLVEFALNAMRSGMSKVDALVDAGHKRARPIIMTTIAMAAGMLPSALVIGTGGEFRAPMAIAVIGGLLVSTMLSLLFVPSLFSVINSLKDRSRRMLVNTLGANKPYKVTVSNA